MVAAETLECVAVPQRRFTIWQTVAFALCTVIVGCDSWKQVDTSAGLAGTFNVDAFERDGRQLIRMHSKLALVVIDPQGGRVIDYHRHVRSGWVYRPPKDDEPTPTEEERIQRMYHPGPNVLAAGPWRARTDSPGALLDLSRHWMAGATTIKLVLLSDTYVGLRWRKTFTLYDTGVLDVNVQLYNTSFRPIDVTADSVLAITPTVASENAEHYRLADAWFSRRVVQGPDRGGRGLPFQFKAETIDVGKRLEWTERWWISSTFGKRGEQPPVKPPPFPPRPWLTVSGGDGQAGGP